MIDSLRRDFNSRWTPHAYGQFLRSLESDAGMPVPFRVSETPVFYPLELLDKMVRYGQELYAQVAHNPAYLAASTRMIPEGFCVPDEAHDALFVQADFGVVRTAAGALEPVLVEIQGFPSIYALQAVMARAYAQTYALDPRLRYLLGGLDEDSFAAVLRRAIVAGHDPADVVLLEIDPFRQKTAADFLATRRLLHIGICPIEEVTRQGRTLLWNGRPIRRIYNRAIADELVRKNIPLAFRWTDDLDVEWAGHPNWFFHLSKFSLPWFRHPCVPATRFLNECDPLPPDLENYVLKPLFSFAGLGVTLGPDRAAIDAIPDAERSHWILQQRIDFTPTLDTPSGLTNVETRIMFVRDGSQLRPLLTVVRTGRGKMMGVDFNKNLDWVGASAGFFFPPA